MNFLPVLGILFIAAAVVILVLMILPEPPGIEPYEQETIEDFPEDNHAA